MYTTKLLSKGTTNAKTSKNKLNTFILYLSPSDQNNKKINLCPFASNGCLKSCLYTAGRGKFTNVQTARQNRSNYLVNDRKAFYNQIAKEITNKVKYYQRKEQKIAIRLNGTSDVDHLKGLKAYANLNYTELVNKVEFYDYTKSLKRALKYKDSPNYTLTFSRSENNEKECIQALKQGINVAAVFLNKLPKTYKGFKVVDGDNSDDLMVKYKGKGIILGLIAKGDAKNDNTNFVIK
jgi:hypothetical protein